MISTDSRSTPRDEATHMPNRNRGPQDPAKPRVLVVDDEDDLLELVRYNLAKDGYDVECVGSGEQALQSARTNPPDLVVLDLMMPKISGLDLLQQIRSVDDDIAVIILTGYPSIETASASIQHEVSAYIHKPFTPQEFREVIARIAKKIKFDQRMHRGVLRAQRDAAARHWPQQTGREVADLLAERIP